MKVKKLVLATAAISAMMAMQAFAGQWLQNATGWWYDYGNGTWPASSWQWIDGNNDGIAECYYFDQYGYCLMNTTTPDGYSVDTNGAWTVNGAVQTRSVSGTPAGGEQQNGNQTNTNVAAVALEDLEPVAKNYYSKRENVRTARNELWGKALRLYSNDSYAEFYAGGQYSRLTATVAPMQGFDEKTEYTLEVYGDDDSLLDTFDINYKTRAFDINVDISGQEYVKLFIVKTEGFYGQSVIVKNAQFQ